MTAAFERRRVPQARWQAHVNAVAAAPAMADWLTDRGSLTARLVARCGQFRVQRIAQHRALCLADEFAALGLARRRQVHQREVVLRCDGTAVVYAHTVVPLAATAAQWPLFGSLGERSLGTTLFNDPLVQRGALEYARLRAAHPLLQRLRTVLPAAQAWTELPARRSLFWRKGGCLLVTEVFLPPVLQLAK